MSIFKSPLIKVNYIVCLDKNNTQIKEAQFKTKKVIYNAFGKLLNYEKEGLAIFQDNKLVDRKALFKNLDSSKKYEIYKIIEMKQHLDYYQQQLKAQQCKVENLEQKEIYYQNKQEELLNTINQNQLIAQQTIMPQQQQFLLSQIITKKERELEDLIIRRQSIFDRDRFESVAYDMTSTCFFCPREIQAYKLQTICQHDYHYDCFKTMIEGQIDTASVIVCFCNKKLPLKMLNQLNDQAQITYFQTKIFQNQLIQIKNYAKSKKLKLTSCPTQNCSFLFLVQQQNEIIRYCPYCKN